MWNYSFSRHEQFTQIMSTHIASYVIPIIVNVQVHAYMQVLAFATYTVHGIGDEVTYPCTRHDSVLADHRRGILCHYRCWNLVESRFNLYLFGLSHTGHDARLAPRITSFNTAVHHCSQSAFYYTLSDNFNVWLKSLIWNRHIPGGLLSVYR